MGFSERPVSGDLTPIKRPGADAGWRVLFPFQRRWPRAAQAGRSAMQRLRDISEGLFYDGSRRSVIAI